MYLVTSISSHKRSRSWAWRSFKVKELNPGAWIPSRIPVYISPVTPHIRKDRRAGRWMRFIPTGHWVALMMSPYSERWARKGEHVTISRKVEYRTGINVVWSRWRVTTLPSWGRNKCIASPRSRTNSNVGVPSLKMWGSLTSLLTIVASACSTSSTVIERCCKPSAGWLQIVEIKGYLILSPS